MNNKLYEYNEQLISQNPAVEVLKSLGYEYISREDCENKRGNLYNVLLRDVLRDQLIKLNSYNYRDQEFKFSISNIEKAMLDLDVPLNSGLVSTNEKIYNALMLGNSYSEILPDGNRQSFSLKYIDFDNIENNIFSVTEEFSVVTQDGKSTLRPDIVLFINGIPFGVIECKRASISINEGISQTIRNQMKENIPHLFKYVQIVMSTNKNETKYATCGTGSKFWAVWQEEDKKWLDNHLNKIVTDREVTVQDKNIISLFSKERFMDIVKYFVLFDKDVKKIARYQQYFAIKEIMKKIEKYNPEGNRESGVIWHTQGSGKSLTMVMLAKYIFGALKDRNPSIVVVTDRIELDKQIHETFNHTRLKAEKARTGKHLVELIEDDGADIITTVIGKFETADWMGKTVENKDIFVLVDESHRSNYGEMHIKMKKVFPNACYLGFTGTPLMKKEKNTMNKFGSLIHKYTIADGVRDKSIVPLLYEGKMVDLTVNKAGIDNALERICDKLNESQKKDVHQKWAKFEKVASTDQRIHMIAFDINNHFLTNFKQKDGVFKGMLATSSRKDAIRYYEAFNEIGDLRVELVMSSPDTRSEYLNIEDESNESIVMRFWNKMMDKYKTPTDYEDSIKNEFIYGDEIDLLIVVDKLLTGFDAPRTTVLYIDKELKEHALLQAIARVNRLYEGKDFGFIIDYRGLLKNLDEAMNIYSGAGLENFDSNDLNGAIYDVMGTIGKLREAYTNLVDIFQFISNKNDKELLEQSLENEDKRKDFYEKLSMFSRYLGIALQSDKVYFSIDQDELKKYKDAIKFYQELRRVIKLRYSDTIDFKEYEPKLEKMMDSYITPEQIIRITSPVDILDEKGFKAELDKLSTPKAKADAIATRLNKSLSEKWDENPSYYKKFSDKIIEIIEEYKKRRIDEKEYLMNFEKLLSDYQKGTPDFIHIPESLKNDQNAQAYYGVVNDVVMEVNESGYDEEIMAQLARELESVADRNVKVDYKNNIDVHRRMEQEWDDILFEYKKKYGYNLDNDRIDRIIANLKAVTFKRY